MSGFITKVFVLLASTVSNALSANIVLFSFTFPPATDFTVRVYVIFWNKTFKTPSTRIAGVVNRLSEVS